MTFLLALSCGVIVANIYYAQPLVGPIAAELGLSPHAAGLIVTLTQIGYGIGLLLIVPLGDLIENRRLVLSVMALGALALATAAFATHMLPFLVAMLCVGLGSRLCKNALFGWRAGPDRRSGFHARIASINPPTPRMRITRL
ncbi:MAG: MFS transporter, partial [Bradyrhizobium sp.]